MRLQEDGTLARHTTSRSVVPVAGPGTLAPPELYSATAVSDVEPYPPTIAAFVF